MKEDKDDTLFEAEEVEQLKDEEREPQGLKWTSGSFLILLGVIFLLWQFGLRIFPNWWLIFLLIPVYWVIVSVWQSYVEADRQMTSGLWRKLLWGLFPFVIVVLGFAIGWNLIWPFILIFIGIGAILFNKND